MSHLTNPADPVALSQYNPGFKTLLVTGATTLGAVTASTVTATTTATLANANVTNALTSGSLAVTGVATVGTTLSCAGLTDSATTNLTTLVVSGQIQSGQLAGLSTIFRTALVVPAATVNITQAQTGTIFFVPSVTVNTNMVLPAVSTGMNYEIIFQTVADGTHTFTLSATGGAILGGAIQNADTAFTAGQCTVVIPTTTVVRNATAANTKAGDRLRIVCDGTTWWVFGNGTHTTGSGGVTWSIT